MNNEDTSLLGKLKSATADMDYSVFLLNVKVKNKIIEEYYNRINTLKSLMQTKTNPDEINRLKQEEQQQMIKLNEAVKERDEYIDKNIEKFIK